MPDWMTHLAIGAGAGKILRLKNLHVVLLGAVLPDIPAILGLFSDLGWLNIDAYQLILVLIPMTSLLAVVCLCLAAAAWLSYPWRAFGLLLLGAVTHLAADMWQIGNVQLPAYPFSFWVFNLPQYNYGGRGDIWISGLAVLALAGLRMWPLERKIRLCWKKGWLCVLPLAVLVTVIALNTPRLEASNVLNIKFLKGEAVSDNEPITLISALVVHSEPFIIKKGRREVEVVWREPVVKGQVISVWGRFHRNRVIADKLVRHSEFQKMTFSVIGAVLLLVYWIDIPALDRRRTLETAKQSP